jgi:hypothetical protein
MADKKAPKIRETAPAYGTLKARGRTPSREFWHTPTFKELARSQRIKPLTREALERADFWPEDEDVEEFLKAAKGALYRKN